jgi:hypothetical protein
MTDHPLFFEYDRTLDAYRSHLGDAFASIEHSFGTLAEARRAFAPRRFAARNQNRCAHMSNRFMELKQVA